MSWPAILLVPTMKASLSLRRFSFSSCAGKPYGMDGHDSRTYIGTTDIFFTNTKSWNIHEKEPPHTDPRWPKQCICGYIFQESDYWQLNNHRLYIRQDTGEELTLREVTVGMMWNATWLIGALGSHPVGPDGQFLMMRLPDGREWMIDGPSTNGTGWDRKGTPPNLTVTPSILSIGYHGYLTEGVLTDDLDGRSY